MLNRHVQRAAWIVGAVFAAVLFFLGGAALRLLMGPISLGPFAGAIEDAINSSVSGVVVRFDQAVLEWSRAEGRVNLIVLGTKVFDLNGRIVAQAPKADLDFDAARLVEGHLRLKRFALVGIQLTGVRAADGSIRLGFGPDQGETNLIDTIRKVLENSDNGPGSLESFSIRNARLAFHDESTNLFLVSTDASFTLQRIKGAMNASLDAGVEISGAPAQISVQAVLNDDGMPKRGTLNVHGLSLPALSGNSETLAVLKPYQLVSDVSADFVLGDNGALQSTQFHVHGSGIVEAPALKETIHVDGFDVAGAYDSAANRIALGAVALKAKEASFTGEAAFDLGWKDGKLATIAAKFDGSNVSVALPAWLEHNLTFTDLLLSANYDRDQRKLAFDQLRASGSPLDADLAGSIAFADGHSPAVQLHGTVGALPVQDLMNYWPIAAAEGAHDWIKDYMPEGRLGPFRIDADFAEGVMNRPVLPDSVLSITFPFEGVTAHYLGAMTPITNGRGEAKLSGDMFRLTVASGAIGPIAITSGNFTIADLHTVGAPGRIKAHTEGRVADVLALIDQPPLGYPKRFGIAPSATDGHAAIDLNFSVPLVADVLLEDVGIDVQGKATDLAAPIDEHRRLEHAAVTFAIDAKSLSSQGTGAISGVPATFKWNEDFTADAGISTRIELAARADQQQRAKLGFTDPSWFKGTTPINLTLNGRRFHFTEGTVKADLADATAAIPIVNIEKKIGTQATGTAKLRFADSGAISVSDLVVTGEGLDVRGTFDLDADGGLINASLSRVRVGANNDFAAVIQPLPDNGLSVHIQGRSLDATRVLGEDKKPGEAAAAAAAQSDNEMQDPLDLVVKTDRVQFHDNFVYNNVNFLMTMGAHQKLTALSLDATSPQKGKVTGKLTMVKGVRNLALDAEDAGTFIKNFTSFGSLRGGTFSARINFPSDAPPVALPAGKAPPGPPPDYQGTVTVSKFVVMDQPFLARLFAAGSLDGPLRLMQGQGISIDKLDAPFSARGKVVTIHEGRASGSAIGATFEGVFDRKQDHIDLRGTLVPVYGLNSFLGGLPVLGDLLASRKGEGIFGLTYAMKGKLEEPAVEVNPLSVLTPGIFRRIFEFSLPKEQPQASAEPPKPAPAPSASAAQTE